MESTVTTKRVMALKTAQIKIDPNTGDLIHVIAVECVLEPGDLERIALMFKQRLPVGLTLTSPQSRMDLSVELIREERPVPEGPVDETTMAEIRERMDVAGTATDAERQDELRSNAILAIQYARKVESQGPESEKEGAADIAAAAIQIAAHALGVDPIDLSITLRDEIRIADKIAPEADPAKAPAKPRRKATQTAG